MIKIEGCPENAKAFASIRNIAKHTKSGIRKAWYDLGKDLKQDAKKFITDPPKTGRVYTRRVNGRIIRHQASAAGESPANMTGNLRNSVGYNVSPSNEITFGAGNNEVPYAKRLELGDSKVKQRPYLIRSIDANEGEAYQHLCADIEKALCK